MSIRLPLLSGLTLLCSLATSISMANTIIQDRGSSIEIMNGVLATSPSTLGVATKRVLTPATQNPTINSEKMGVIVNQTLKREGYINGEIAFKTKSGSEIASLATLPGYQSLTAGGVYVVRARTISEFVAILNQLKSDANLQWVEPNILYGPSVAP